VRRYKYTSATIAAHYKTGVIRSSEQRSRGHAGDTDTYTDVQANTGEHEGNKYNLDVADVRLRRYTATPLTHFTVKHTQFTDLTHTGVVPSSTRVVAYGLRLSRLKLRCL
jgi:hypothetical protein